MEEIERILDKKSGILKESIKCYMILNSIKKIDAQNQTEIKEHFNFLFQKSKAIQHLDQQFLIKYNEALSKHDALRLSDLPKNILQAFKPIQSQIQLIQDLESILKQESIGVSTLEQQLKKYEQFKNASKAYGHK